MGHWSKKYRPQIFKKQPDFCILQAQIILKFVEFDNDSFSFSNLIYFSTFDLKISLILVKFLLKD